MAHAVPIAIAGPYGMVPQSRHVPGGQSFCPPRISSPPAPSRLPAPLSSPSSPAKEHRSEKGPQGEGNTLPSQAKCHTSPPMNRGRVNQFAMIRRRAAQRSGKIPQNPDLPLYVTACESISTSTHLPSGGPMPKCRSATTSVLNGPEIGALIPFHPTSARWSRFTPIEKSHER